MLRTFTAMIGATILVIGMGSQAWGFGCPSSIASAEAVIAKATDAMNAMPDGDKKGLAHTLIDDAKMLLMSAKHNHEKPAAGAYDHSRAVAKSRSAESYAEAAIILAGG